MSVLPFPLSRSVCVGGKTLVGLLFLREMKRAGGRFSFVPRHQQHIAKCGGRCVK